MKSCNTKENFTLGERDDFDERKSNASFKILPMLRWGERPRDKINWH